jgi:flagellar motor switch protein FliN/FliY
MPDTAQAVEEQVAPGQDSVSESRTKVQAPEFTEAVDTGTNGTGSSSIDILLDMSVPVTVTIGSTMVPIRRLLHLGPGSVIKLDRSVDSPMDLYLKDTKFATGSIVIVDGHFAVKIKQILGLGEMKPEPKQ